MPKLLHWSSFLENQGNTTYELSCLLRIFFVSLCMYVMYTKYWKEKKNDIPIFIYSS